MAAIRERIIAYLQRHPEGVDDDELTRALGLKYRQQANDRAAGWRGKDWWSGE